MSEQKKTLKYSQNYNDKTFKEEIEFVIKSEEFDTFFQKAYAEIAKNASAKGFRKGKVPQNIVLTNYYPQIADRAVELAVVDHLARIDNIEPKPLEPFIIQSIDYIECENKEKKDIKIIVSYLPTPSVKIVDVDKIKIESKKAKKATEEEVENEIKNIWFSYAQKLDPNTKQEDYSKDKITQEFLTNSGINKENPEIKSVEDLKKFVENYINETYKRSSEMDLEEEIRKELIKLSDFSKVDGIIERELSKRVETYLEKFRQIGMNPEEYLQKSNINIDDLKKEWREKAEEDVKFEILLQEYGKANGIAPTEEEIQSEISKLDNETKKMYNFDEDRLRKLITYYFINNKSYMELMDKVKKTK